MTIEIQQPRLEALIEQRMASGNFQSVEDLLLQMLGTSADVQGESGLSVSARPERKTMDEVLAFSRGLLTDEEVDTLFKRDPSAGRPIDLS